MPLADELAHLQLLNLPLGLLTQCSPNLPQCCPKPTQSPSPTPAATSTTALASGASAVFATSAPGAVISLTGNWNAPPPVDQLPLVTPLRPLQLERELSFHPDKDFVSQLIHNIRHGCCIGYEGPHFPHIARHLPSARAHPHIISEALAKECQAGRMAGSYSAPPLPNTRCSGLGVVPKKDGGWRTICDLSSPPGSSINDFIDPQRYSLRYCTIDSAIAILNAIGPGALIGKFDLQNSFRIMPVRKEDWHLLAIHWEGQWYLDKCLPFGLRSSPALFNQLAETLVWALRHNHGVTHIINYLASSRLGRRTQTRANVICSS